MLHITGELVTMLSVTTERGANVKSCWFSQWQWGFSTLSSAWGFSVEDLLVYVLNTSTSHNCFTLQYINYCTCWQMCKLFLSNIRHLHTDIRILMKWQWQKHRDNPHSDKISLIKILPREDIRPKHSRLVLGLVWCRTFTHLCQTLNGWKTFGAKTH